MNKMVKAIILIVYTIVIFSCAFLIVNSSSKSHRFEEYQNKAYNEDFMINAQVIENRQSVEETKTDYEYTKYDMYLSLYKLQVAEVSNILAYVGVESEDLKYTYTETTSAKTMSNGTYRLGTISFLNSSTAFAYKKIEKTNDKVIISNHTPKTIYIKLVYNIVYGNDDDRVVHKKELNYTFDFKEVDTTNFDSFEKGNIDSSSYIGNKDDIFKFKLTHKVTEATSNSVALDSFAFYSYTINKSKLEKDEQIVDSKLSIYGVIENEDAVNSKYFTKYVRLISCIGTKHLDHIVSSTRTANIAKSYAVNKLYVIAEFKLSSGRNFKYNYYLNVEDLN